MKKPLLLFYLGICLLIPTINYGQQPIKPNEFKIGMFGPSFCKTHIVNGCDVPYEDALVNGKETSLLNVLSQDGFNLYQTMPDEWTSENFLKSYLKLANSNKFKMYLDAHGYFKPAVDINGNYLGYGTNVYDNCDSSILACQNPYSQNYFRPNYDNFLNNIYKIPPFKDIIYGYQMSEEAAFWHWYHFADNCEGNDFKNPNYFLYVEVPPTNVNNAISYYKNVLASAGITNHKMVILEANHTCSIIDSTIDSEGVYNAPEYIQLLNKLDKRDVFLESSYVKFPPVDWLTQHYDSIFNTGPHNNVHYLGYFKSIEYAKNYASEVHKMISIEGRGIPDTLPSNTLHYHSDSLLENANWLWFQAYNSIVHGVSGVWFWDIRESWSGGETDNWNNVANVNRFIRNYFPKNYKNFVSNLAKELRYLFNNNILSTDPNTIVATKTDFEDSNCIVPPYSTYIPTNLPLEKRTKNYGLRYTIRSNGAETFMIITNPLPVSLTVNLNFSNSSNQIIQNSTGVSVLFDTNQFGVNSIYYKRNRNSNINLVSNTVGNQYPLSFTGNKNLTISFGPMDVKVLKFISAPPNHNNGWDRVWSNYGSGRINGHYVGDSDLIYPGDYDGDGTDELLCVGYTPNGNGDWISLLKYKNNNWEWEWSNYGVSSAGNGIYPYRNTFIVGDFDGNGSDELLGNELNGFTTLFKYDNGNWNWIWSDSGNSSHPIRPYKDKFYAGNFDGDIYGKDELLGCDLPNGYTTSFYWNGNDFVWDWSDYGDTTHAIRPYRTKMLSGDFDDDGKDELLGFSSWSTLFHYDNSDWHWGWSTYNANNFNGWAYPTANTDTILAGNIDLDGKDELFFLATDPLASWATTMDLINDQDGWNWNWSGNPQYSVPFIDDWSLASNGGSKTRYCLVKAKANEPKYLMTMRKFCNSYLVNMYKRISNDNFKNSNSTLIGDLNCTDLNNSIKIFPNPSQGKIDIISDNSSLIALEIFNIGGQLIYQSSYNYEQRIQLDISEHPNGIYFAKFTDSNNFITFQKFILNKQDYDK